MVLNDSSHAVVVSASTRLNKWIECQGFKGWDPHDALNSPILRALSGGNLVLSIGWLQLLKRLPINIRPILGIIKGYNPKAMGLFLASYLRKYAISKEERHLEVAERMADWLHAAMSPGYHGACWGYDFPWPNRVFYAPAGTPTVVNTAFIGMAFLDGYHMLGRSDFLQVARSACNFVLSDLNRIKGQHGFCFSYTPIDHRQVHNANMLGAALLTRVGALTGESELVEIATKAVEFTVHHQQPDGSWLYGVGKSEGWIDGFHTAYVLDCLYDFVDMTGRDEYLPNFEAGLRFYQKHFFLDDGTPRYYANRTYPIDIHSASQAILTFHKLSDRYPILKNWAKRVATWTIKHMQSRDGFFFYQIHRFYTIRIPYMRWAQAWMQRALVEFQYKHTKMHGK